MSCFLLFHRNFLSWNHATSFCKSWNIKIISQLPGHIFQLIRLWIIQVFNYITLITMSRHISFIPGLLLSLRISFLNLRNSTSILFFFTTKLHFKAAFQIFKSKIIYSHESFLFSYLSFSFAVVKFVWNCYVPIKTWKVHFTVQSEYSLLLLGCDWYSAEVRNTRTFYC